MKRIMTAAALMLTLTACGDGSITSKPASTPNTPNPAFTNTSTATTPPVFTNHSSSTTTGKMAWNIDRKTGLANLTVNVPPDIATAGTVVFTAVPADAATQAPTLSASTVAITGGQAKTQLIGTGTFSITATVQATAKATAKTVNSIGTTISSTIVVSTAATAWANVIPASGGASTIEIAGMASTPSAVYACYFQYKGTYEYHLASYSAAGGLNYDRVIALSAGGMPSDLQTDGTKLYVVADKSIYAYDLAGNLMWTYFDARLGGSKLAVDPAGGTIYTQLQGTNGKILALTTTGAVRWTSPPIDANYVIGNVPFVVAADKIYAAGWVMGAGVEGQSGIVFALNKASGGNVWSYFPTEYNVQTISADTTGVYISGWSDTRFFTQFFKKISTTAATVIWKNPEWMSLTTKYMGSFVTADGVFLAGPGVIYKYDTGGNLIWTVAAVDWTGSLSVSGKNVYYANSGGSSITIGRINDIY